MKKTIIIALLALVIGISCEEKAPINIESQIAELAEVRIYQYNVTALKCHKEKRNIIFKSEITGFYNGHVDVGIKSVDDITLKASENGDTAWVTAKISPLNANGWFIDGTPRYIGGKDFSNAEMKQLDQEANDSIFNRFLSVNGKAEAEKNMSVKLSEMLLKLGYKVPNVKVEFTQAAQEVKQ